MSLFSRLTGRGKRPIPTITTPDDKHIQRRLNAAKRVNDRAVSSFVEAAQKQERDAEFARQVISDLLERADKLKASDHAGIQK